MDTPPPLSVRQQIKRRILNTTIGQWMRGIDAVLDDYTPSGGTVEVEAERVTKLTLLLMLMRYYDENDICLLLDSSSLRLPKSLEDSGEWEIRRILDGKPLDDDASPGDDPSASSLSLRLDDEGELEIDED